MASGTNLFADVTEGTAKLLNSEAADGANWQSQSALGIAVTVFNRAITSNVIFQHL